MDNPILRPKSKARKKRLSTRGSLGFYISLMALPMLQFLIFYVYVNFNSFLLAFQRYEDGIFVMNNIKDPSDFWRSFITLFHYKDIYQQSLGVYFKNSAIVFAVGVFVGMFLAIFFSYYIYKRRKLSFFFKFFLFLPSVIPSILLTSIFTGFLNDYLTPLFRDVFGWKSLPTVLIDENSNASLAIVLAFGTWISFGTQVLLYTNAMEQINPGIIEADEIDGCTPLRELFQIVVPTIMPTIGTFLISAVAGFFTNQALLFNFFPNGTNRFGTVGYFIYLNANPAGMTADSYPLVAALGLLCAAITIPVTVLIRKFVKRFEA